MHTHTHTHTVLQILTYFVHNAETTCVHVYYSIYIHLFAYMRLYTCTLLYIHTHTHTLTRIGRQWYYQTCTEFGYFQTTDSAHQPFGDLVSLASFTEVCRLAFSVTSAQAFQAVRSTNAYYGGREINATNIVFPNGSIDPWHALGITKDISPTLRAIFIEGTAHCANMYPARDADLPSLAKAREGITNSIGTWLNAL